MDVQEVLRGARDAIAVRRVYGEPYEKNGLAVIPAAAVLGGGGGGEGESEQGKGSGSGFGLVARPAGAWVVKDGDVVWKPALDLNRVNLGWQVVTLAGIVTAGRVLIKRAPQRRPLVLKYAPPRWRKWRSRAKAACSRSG